MKTMYIECNMGAAGDMLMAALLELFPNPDEMVEKLNALKIPDVVYHKEQSVKCGITGTYMNVLVKGKGEHYHAIENFVHDSSHKESIGETHQHSQDAHGHHHIEEEHHHSSHHPAKEEHHHSSHHHSGMAEIEHMIEHMEIPQIVKENAKAVYQLIAEAESHVHNRPVTQIHFHEVGTLDAVADVVGVCYLIHALGVEHIVASPIQVGRGQVACAHGILPVPAPATAYILRQIPIYSGEIEGELCTPTGAALLKYFSKQFGAMPIMCVERIGYGMGRKDFAAANCVRILLGETGEI